MVFKILIEPGKNRAGIKMCGGPPKLRWKHRKMDFWKTLATVAVVSISAQAAAENKGSYQNSMMMITMAPTFLVSGTTALTMLATKNFKPAKPDALAFIGSDGEIRGAQFEHASRFYRATYSPPLMSDHQLAQAIAVSF